MVGRLAQLALVAAAGDGLDKVDAATVERAWRELVPASGPVAEAALEIADDEADHDDSPPANPHVRVVRRLWG